MSSSLILLRLRHLLLGLGWPALLGLALALAALGTDLWATSSLESELEGLKKKRSELRKQVVQATKSDSGPVLKLDQLQDKQRIDGLLAELHASAQKNAIVLEQGEYRIQAEPGTRLARYRMVLPAKGSYPQLRAWLDELATSQPGLQIDELSFKRENITQENVEARISFSLLVRLS